MNDVHGRLFGRELEDGGLDRFHGAVDVGLDNDIELRDFLLAHLGQELGLASTGHGHGVGGCFFRAALRDPLRFLDVRDQLFYIQSLCKHPLAVTKEDPDPQDLVFRNILPFRGRLLDNRLLKTVEQP